MKTISHTIGSDAVTFLPDRLLSVSAATNSINFISYASRIPIIKGRSTLKKHMFSLLTEGEKVIHAGGKAIHVTNANVLLLAAGNYLYTERFHKNEQIKSIMVFFDDDLLQNVLSQLDITNVPVVEDQEMRSFVLFPKDDYLHNYIKSVQLLVYNGLLTESLQLAKLEELLIFLYIRYPDTLRGFQHSYCPLPREERIKQVMEDSLLHNFSIGELAFLCHMSLPTFKRKFQQLYNQSPARWIQLRRLAAAADLLRRKGAKPAEVYLDAGYENHSSFSRAFKQQFGVLPKDY